MSLDVELYDLACYEEFQDLEVGSLAVATEAMSVYESHHTELTLGHLHHWSILGEGSFRTGLLHIPTGTVYKVPTQMGEVGDANPAEAEFWRMMRQHPEFAEFVPPHTLWTTVYGQFRDLTVMAVPYLGSQSLGLLPPLELIGAAIHVGCHDACIRNVRHVHGRWYLIDASGSEHDDDPTEFGPTAGDGCSRCNPEYDPDVPPSEN